MIVPNTERAMRKTRSVLEISTEVVKISILCKVYLVSVSHYRDTLSDTVCQFVSEVEDYSLCGYCHSLKREQWENEDIVKMNQHGHCLSLKWSSPTCSYQSIIITSQQKLHG